MNKVKVRCSVCGKSFKSPSLKKTVCPTCEAAAKRAKHQQSAEPAVAAAPVSSSTVDVRAALRAAQENQGQFGAYRPPAPPPPAPVHEKVASHPHRASAPGHSGKPDRSDHHGAAKQRDGKEAKARPPKQPRVPKPRTQTKPFEPTPEQMEAIRLRYFELAKPEFNGIRHQIATELGIPLRAVKQVIKVAREENQIQSWWEQGGALPSAEELDRIRELYIPLLPEPEVGVHKVIASTLRITNTSVYHAIGQIRTDLHLPRYSPREIGEAGEAHGSESDAHQEHPALPLASGE
jgi:hypothetical protein